MSAISLRHSGPIACLLAVALTASACGGSSGKGAAGQTSAAGTSAAGQTSAAGTSAAASSSATGSSATSAPAATGAVAAPSNAATSTAPAPAKTTKVVATGGGEFCKRIANAVNNPIKPTGTGSLKDQKALIEKSLAEGEAALAKAPAAIRGDAVIVLGAIDNLFKALEKVDYDYTKLDPKALSSLSSPAVTAAETRLAAYVKDSCGISLGTG